MDLPIVNRWYGATICVRSTVTTGSKFGGHVLWRVACLALNSSVSLPEGRAATAPEHGPETRSARRAAQMPATPLRGNGRSTSLVVLLPFALCAILDAEERRRRH